MELNRQGMLKILSFGTVDEKIRALGEIDGETEIDAEVGSTLLELVQEPVKGGCRPTKMSPLMRSILKAILIVNNHPEIRLKFRHANIMLERLVLWFNKEFEVADLQLLLCTIQILAKGCSNVWKPPSIKSLIRLCCDLIVTQKDNTCYFIHAVKILIYLLRDKTSSISYLAFCGDSDFKSMWNVLSSIVFSSVGVNPESRSRKEEDCRKVTVAIHLMFLLESSYNSKLLHWGFTHAARYADKIRISVLVEPGALDSVDEDGDICQFAELVDFLYTLFDQVNVKLEICEAVGLKPSDLGVPRKILQEGVECKNLVTTLSQQILKVLVDCIDKFARPEHSESCCQLITILTPTFVPFFELEESYKLGFAAMRELMEYFEQSQRKEGFRTYLHLITNVVSAGGDALSAFEEELIGSVRHLEISKSTDSADLDIHITSCRILSIMNRVPYLGDELKRILNVGDLDRLLSSFVKIPKEYSEHDQKATTFVIETLGLLSDNSRSSILLNLLMKYIMNEGTAYHISAAILSGNETLVTRALKITGSVSFSRDSLIAVGKSLSKMRAGIGHEIPSRFTLKSTFNAPLAREGLNDLEESLIALAIARRDEKDERGLPTLASEMIALHSMKSSIQEAEQFLLREQLYEMEQAITQLKALNEKQSQLFAQRVSVSESKDLQIAQLSHRLELSRAHADEHNEELQKKLNELTERLTFKNEKMLKLEASLEEEMKKIEQQHKENKKLKIQVSKTEALRAEAQENLKEMTAAAKVSEKTITVQMQRITALENEARNKEDERRRYEVLLENEKRRVDSIRGLLGNNIGGL